MTNGIGEEAMVRLFDIAPQLSGAEVAKDRLFFVSEPEPHDPPFKNTPGRMMLSKVLL